MSQPVTCSYSLRSTFGARERRDPSMSLREIQDGRAAVHAPARLGLSILAAGYEVAVRARAAMFDRGLRGVRQLSVAVTSVGNLTVGGTGKTPFVAWLCDRAIAAKRRPGVLSRGYGPRPAGSPLSDEGTLLRDLLGAKVPQVEDPDRVRGGWRLLSKHPETDLVVLDDGFQHRRLARDADVVLLDATDPFGGGRMLPRGRLREPARALSRASAVVVTRAERLDAGALASLVRDVRRHLRSPVVAVARTVPRALVTALGEERPVEELRGRSVFAVAAIGNPAAFEATLTDAGARVVGRVFERDHAVATTSDAARVAALARAARADRVVVTRKDLVKWRTLPTLPEGLCALDVGLEVVEGEAALLEAALPQARR